MKIGILESYTDVNFSLRISSAVKKEFCRSVVEYGIDEEKREKKHIGYNITLYVNGHSSKENPNVFLRKKGIFLRKESIVEYFGSIPVDYIKYSDCKIKEWIRMMFILLEFIEDKSGIGFKILELADDASKKLCEEFVLNKKYKFDTSAHDLSEPAVIVL